MQNGNKYNTFKKHDAKKRSKLFKFWISAACQIHTQYRPRFKPVLPTKSSCCAGGPLYQQHLQAEDTLHCVTTAQSWWRGTSTSSPSITEPGLHLAQATLLVASLASALHSWFHLNWGMLNERNKARVLSVPRKGKALSLTMVKTRHFRERYKKHLNWEFSPLKSGFCLTLC